MSDRVALADRVWDAFNARDWDAFFACNTPDLEVRTDGNWPGGGEYSGRAEFMPFIEQFLEAWEELRWARTAEPFMVGDRLIDPSSWQGRGRDTGLEGTIEFWVCFSFEGDLISRADFFLKREDAVKCAQQLGGVT